MSHYADTTIKDKFSSDLGGEVVNAYHLKSAHTGADSVIHFEKANIAHPADLVFHNVFPYVNLEDEAAAAESIPGVTGRTSKWDDALAGNIREAYKELVK